MFKEISPWQAGLKNIVLKAVHFNEEGWQGDKHEETVKLLEIAQGREFAMGGQAVISKN